MSRIDPVLRPVAIADLRPTQITVGLHEVNEKRRRWREKHGEHRGEFLGSHMIPVVLGPKGHPYVIDHHHLARALHEEGVTDVAITVTADLSRLPKDAFWTYLDNRAWCHPYDAAGVRRHFDDIPKTIMKLVDDPYRSLAGGLRRSGGYAKDLTPFSEFIWADFLRRRIPLKQVEKDFEKATEKALMLAKSQEANIMPGWCGPSED
jgi:hypothetical protein